MFWCGQYKEWYKLLKSYIIFHTMSFHYWKIIRRINHHFFSDETIRDKQKTPGVNPKLMPNCIYPFGDSVFKKPMPIGSMYGIFTYIYHQNQPNVGKYTIHGSYGMETSESPGMASLKVLTWLMPSSHFPEKFRWLNRGGVDRRLSHQVYVLKYRNLVLCWCAWWLYYLKFLNEHFPNFGKYIEVGTSQQWLQLNH